MREDDERGAERLIWDEMWGRGCNSRAMREAFPLGSFIIEASRQGGNWQRIAVAGWKRNRIASLLISKEVINLRWQQHQQAQQRLLRNHCTASQRVECHPGRSRNANEFQLLHSFCYNFDENCTGLKSDEGADLITDFFSIQSSRA